MVFGHPPSSNISKTFGDTFLWESAFRTGSNIYWIVNVDKFVFLSKNGLMMKKALEVGCWMVQGLLAVTLLWAGYTKLFTPKEILAGMWSWTAENSTLVVIAGIADMGGGLGIILPSLFRMKPQLVRYAAMGIALLMIAAAVFHVARGEMSEIGINVFVLLLTLFVIWVKKEKSMN